MKYSRASKYLVVFLVTGAGLAFCARSILVGKGVPEVSFVSFIVLAFITTVSVVGAAIVPLSLVLLARKPPHGSRIVGGMFACLVLAIPILFLAVRAFDRSLLASMEEYPNRRTIGGQTRNVRMSPIPSETILRIEIPDEGALRSGFGVARETFEAIPLALNYDIYISSPGKPPREWVRKRVDAGSPDGWTVETLDLATLGGGALEIIMKADYADHSVLSKTLSLCGYYAKLIFVPGFRFDAGQRAAVWIEPTATPLRAPGEKNVILIGIDALRADHMSAYGYERETTPNLDAFAESAALFENCYTAAPWTLPSFFSMLTSTYPSVHQYGTNFHGEVRAKTRTAYIWKIGTISPDYGIETLAEILREQGYYTAAFANNPFLSIENEFDRGFDEFNAYGPTSVEGVGMVLPWLDRHRNDKFFLFFHVMDPHDFSIKGSEIYNLPPRFGDTDGDLLEEETNKYDTSLSYCDEQMGELLEGMKWLGLGHNTLVIVTSDHGEELHDRGGTGHGHSLKDELLRVPLILRPPGGLKAPKIFDERVSTLDIAPTILDALKMPAPAYYQGTSLAPLLAGDSLASRPIFAEALGSGHEKKAVVADDHKLIYTATSNEFELYNLKDNPGEKRNLALKAPEIERKMKETLQEFIALSREGFHIALNPPAGLEMCEGTLSTEGAFMRVMPLDLTKSDIFRVDDNSQRILFRLRSEHGVSGFFFRVFPPDAAVKLELTTGDGPSPGIRLGATDGNPLAAPVEFDREMLRALGASDRPGMEDEGLYVWLKETGRESKTIEIDTKTKEKLEALGYLGGAPPAASRR